MEFINKIDYFFTEMFHKLYLWGGEFTNVVMRLISHVGEYGAIFLAIGLVLGLFKRTRKIGGTIILSVAIGFVISNLVLKNLVHRVRPFEASAKFETWWAGSNGKIEKGSSFPSGHVTAAMAFSMAVILTTNKKYNWPTMFLPLIMASSRIYLMVHYFSDCIGGMAVGLVSGIIAYLILNWMYKSKIKLFVWARNLELFKGKSSKSKSISSEKSETKQKPVIPDVYITQDEENEGPVLIRQMTHEIDNKENTNTK